ncbi:MAG: hypothetical protein CMF73_01545 [Maricaulis sp.]|jgi:ketosteroid isomerase-like protein|nr:hypothetical protein [Maricaulis sp.]
MKPGAFTRPVGTAQLAGMRGVPDIAFPIFRAGPIMFRLLFAVVLLSVGITPVTSAQPASVDLAPRALAEAWLDAYARQDFDRMRSLMTADTVFVDPTSFEVAAVTQPIDWRGPEAITAGIAAWGMDHAVYTVDRSYEASGNVVFSGHIDVVYGDGASSQTFRYPITTIIRVADGHVVEHRDYTDFAGALRISAPD